MHFQDAQYCIGKIPISEIVTHYGDPVYVYHGEKILEQYGVKVMDIIKGAPFNADVQEAITQVAAEANMKGKIVDVVEKGYLLNDKVIRFAKVVIGA